MQLAQRSNSKQPITLEQTPTINTTKHKKSEVFEDPTFKIKPDIFLQRQQRIDLPLIYTLRQHSIGNLHEARDIGSLNIVDVSIRLLAILNTLFMYRVHNIL